MKLPHPARLGLALVLAFTGLTAAEKLDLERIAPVPGDQPVPIQDFFRRSLLFYPALNPAGTHLAALITNTEERGSTAVVDLKTNKVEFSEGDRRSIHGIVWLNDQRVLTFGNQLYAHDVGRLAYGYPLLRGTNAYLIGVPRQDRIHPLFWIDSGAESGPNDIGAVRIDSTLEISRALEARDVSYDALTMEINRRHILKQFPRATEGVGSAQYYSDKDGELAFALTGRDGFEKLHRLADGKWVPCPVDLDANYFIAAGNEKDQIVVCPRARTGKPLPLQFMNAVTGQLGEVLLQDKGYDAFPTVYRDRQTGVIVGAHYNRAGPQTVWFDENYKAIQKLLDASFPGLVVSIIDNNEPGNLFLVGTYSDRQPMVYHWVDVTTHQAGLVKSSQPWIDAKRMQPTNVIKFKTRDGRTLDGYVTLPAGATKANPPPLVVLPADGAWGRLNWGFDNLTQFLASRGYAVLRPNHRGAYGYDWQFSEEDRYDFLKMSDDITDATATLVKSGVVDGKRIGIMGTDVGAYLAISGVVHEPDLYRCAVVCDGFFDWEDYMVQTKFFQYSSNTYAYFRRKLGDPKTEKEKYQAISSINFISRAHAAVFVAHDKADSDIYLAQSRRLVSELAKNKLPHDSYFSTNTWVPKAHLEHQVERYARIEAFLAKNLMAAK